MEITVFIKNSNSPFANRKKTICSLKHEGFEIKQFVLIDNFKNIVYDDIKTEWFLVIHDDESLDKELLEAIPILLKEYRVDVFSFYKRVISGKYSICPRLFRKHVKINPNCLYPENQMIPILNILNGFVKSHDCDALGPKISETTVLCAG